MLLSPTERIRFTICYPDYSHEELGKMFNTSDREVIAAAKSLGIYQEKRRKNDILPSMKKSTSL